jgi:hypothetical protein
MGNMMTPSRRLSLICLACRDIDQAVERLTTATRQAWEALPTDHDAAKALDAACEAARVARAKLDIARKRAQEAVNSSKG